MYIITIAANTYFMIASACIIILFLNLIIFPFRISFRGRLSVFGNDGLFEIRLLGIKLFTAALGVRRVDAIHNDLILNAHGKESYYHLNTDKGDERSVARLLDVRFFPNVNVISLDFTTRVGKRDDAFATTILLGSVRNAICIILAGIKNRQSIIINDSFSALYNTDCLDVEFACIIDVTFADIIYGLVFNRRKSQGRKNDYTKKRASY